MKGRVSIVRPTRNSAEFLEKSLKTIKLQSYRDIETIIVDGNSRDTTLAISKKYHCRIINFIPKVKMGLFDAPYKRNLGMDKATGEYVYWMDADMELPKNLIREAVALCKKRYDAVVLPEDSFGIGIWAAAKNLERRCYWNDNTVECARFYKKSVWKSIGGFDESLGAGGDDLDLAQKLLEKGYRVGRTKSIVRHNEGNLTFVKLYKKKFMYGREIINYFFKRPKSSFISYFPLRPAYVRNWKLMLKHPHITLVFVFMRIVEYIAGLAGVIYSIFEGRV
jgi:glycosyltransferase involved in cell wall biosynthesis